MPSSPDFSSCPCRISAASSAHLPRLGNAVQFRTPPSADFHRFNLNRVARVTACPVSVSPNLILHRIALGREVAVATWRPLQPYQPDLPGIELRQIEESWRLSTCPSGLCVCCRWRPACYVLVDRGAVGRPPCLRLPALLSLAVALRTSLASKAYSAFATTTRKH